MIINFSIEHSRLRRICSPNILKRSQVTIGLRESFFDTNPAFLLDLSLADSINTSGLKKLKEVADELKRLSVADQDVLLKEISRSLAKIHAIILGPSSSGEKFSSMVANTDPFLVNILENNIKYFREKQLHMFLGPVLRDRNDNLLPAGKRWTNKVDGLKLSRESLIEAFVLCSERGVNQLELLVVGTSGIESYEIEQKIWSVIGDKDEFEREVFNRLDGMGTNERHSALMGGIGLSAGYHRHTKNFIFNLRTGVDHIWGRFRQTGPQSMDTESVPRLGWGITLGAGADYKFTEKSTIGLEGGVRFSEFKIPRMDKPTDTKSSWFMAPYAQIVCGFYPTPDYSISVFTGYFFPRTFAVKAEGTRITEGTQCKVDGIFGGLRFARYF